MASRKNSDEYYVIDLCDKVLGVKASRQHTFDFLRGDGKRPRKLPVDAYYEDLKLVVEYRERQHTESVPFFNKTSTVSGVSRDDQRRIYDQRRRDVLPQHGIRLVEISYADFKHDKRKCLIRDPKADIEIIQNILSQAKRSIIETISNQTKDHTTSAPQVKDGTQTWVYRAYRKLGCLFMLIVTLLTTFLFSYLAVCVFHLDDGSSFFAVMIALVVVLSIFHFYTTGVDEKLQKKRRSKRKITSSTYSNADRYPVCCPQCGSNNIGPTDNGDFVCMDCGISWYQQYL